MTKYIAEILKQLGIDYLNYKIDNYWEESTDKNVINLFPKNKDYNPDTSDVLTIYWEDDSCYLYIENNLEIDEFGHISLANPLLKPFSLPVFNLSLTPEDIMKLWQNNKENVFYPDERFGSIFTTEVPDRQLEYDFSQGCEDCSSDEADGWDVDGDLSFLGIEDRTIDKTDFPWKDVEACMEDVIEPAGPYITCPICGKELTWIRFCSPPWTWEQECGREGPLALCKDCHKQVVFYCELMN